TFTAENGTFTVSFPGAPVARDDSMVTSMGTIALRVYSVELGEHIWERHVGFYSVTVGDAPHGMTTDVMLVERRKALLETIKGTIVTESRGALESIPCQDLEVARASGTVARARSCVGNGRLYELL